MAHRPVLHVTACVRCTADIGQPVEGKHPFRLS
jgi:hypothetical protein